MICVNTDYVFIARPMSHETESSNILCIKPLSCQFTNACSGHTDSRHNRPDGGMKRNRNNNNNMAFTSEQYLQTELSESPQLDA